MLRWILTLLYLCTFSLSFGSPNPSTHYSPLSQITATNVHELKRAWSAHTGDVSYGSTTIVKTAFQATPVFANQTLYVCTPFFNVVALNPGTGQQRWKFNSQTNLSIDLEGTLHCRGVSYWELNPHTSNSAQTITIPFARNHRSHHKICQRRIFFGTIEGKLFAIDADTGKRCQSFGKNGSVNLNDFDNHGAGKVDITSPPAIYNNLVIVGTGIADNQRADAPDGIVYAFDANTGKLVWQWDPIPLDMRNKTGAANTWAPIAVDQERGILYLPTSSPSPDFFGGLRTSEIPYATALVALDAKTGKPLWHFQTVHHNLFDYDLASQPLILNLNDGNHTTPAVVQGTKTGLIFAFDRYTGKPLFPIVETPVAKSNVSGEVAAKTQPVPEHPAALTRQTLSADDAWGPFPWDRISCRRQIKKLLNKGMFTPPSLQGSFVLPGFTGGINWGGAAFNPNDHYYIVNTSNLAFALQLIPREQIDAYKKTHPDMQIGLQRGTPFAMARKLLVSPSGAPCVPPPWGTLAAVNLLTGKIVWQVPIGSKKLFGPLHTPQKWGSPTIGGPIVTRTGIIFIASTLDNKLHAFDEKSGRLMWEGTLPAPGMATPITYQYKGKQYVVIAAGGHGLLKTKLSDAVIAFALP